MMKFSDIFEFQGKSSIKAGDGLDEGRYPFYTSSRELSKYCDDFLFQGDSLIFGTGGDASVHFNSERFSVSTDCLVARPAASRKIFTKYFYYFLKGNIRILEKGFKGAGLKHISKSYISQIDLPERDYQYQKEVVEILDCADLLRQKRKQSIQLLDDFLRATFLDLFGDPVINEKKWMKKDLSEITSLITDGKHGDCQNESDSGFYFISAKDIHDGIIDYSQARQITKEDFDEVHQRTNLEVDDLVMVNTGATIGKTAIAKENINTSRTTFQKSVAVIKLNKAFLLSIFLKYVFALRLKAFVGISSGSAQKNLLLSQMRKFQIILPPIEMQNKFSIIVANIERIKEAMLDSHAELDNQFNALIQKYFS